MSRASLIKANKKVSDIHSQIVSLEHLKSEAETDLNFVVKQVSDARKDLESIATKLHEHALEIDRLVSVKRDLVNDIKELENLGVIIRSESDSIIESANTTADEVLISSFEKLDHLASLISDKESQIIAQEKTIESNNDLIEKLRGKLISGFSDSLSVMSTSSLLIDEKAREEELLSEVRSKRIREEMVLDSIRKEIEVEKEKVAAPMLALSEKDAIMKRERRDLDIYAARIRAQFRKLFPGQEMKF